MKRSISVALLLLLRGAAIGADEKPASVHFIKEQTRHGATIRVKSDYLTELPFRLKTDHGTFTELVRGQSY